MGIKDRNNKFMTRYSLLLLFLLILCGCEQNKLMMDYDHDGQLEQWEKQANHRFVSKTFNSIDLNELISSLASNSYERIQQLTYCSQISDHSLKHLPCDEKSLNRAFHQLQLIQDTAYRFFNDYPLTINVDGQAITVNALSHAELITALSSSTISFEDAEKALVVFLASDRWLQNDAATGLAQALAIYYRHKNNYHLDEGARCNPYEESKALHAWLLGSYLYADNIPLQLNYAAYKDPEQLFNAFIDPQDPWSFTMDSVISRSRLFEDLYFRLPAKMVVNAAGEAVIYRLHQEVADNKINLKIGDKVLGFNDYSALQDPAEKQHEEMLKALNGDKKFHWKIARANTQFILTTEAENKPAPIEDSLISDVFLQDGQSLHYIKLDSFIEGFESAINATLSHLSTQPASSLILDLRSNSGGSNSLLSFMLKTLFADEIEPLSLMMRENGLLHKHVIGSHIEPSPRSYQHYYILLNESSMSAAEQLTHAIQHRADVTVLANHHSYGKRVSSHIWQGNCGKSYQLTTSFAVNASGQLLPANGIKPDITVTAPYNSVMFTHEQDPFIQRVLELAKKPLNQSLKPQEEP